MKILTPVIGLLVALSFASLSQAGDELCNGGDVILCPDKAPQVLDILERNVLYGFDIHPEENRLRISHGYRIEYAVEDLLRPLRKKTPELHQCLMSYVNDPRFWSEFQYVKNHEFREVDDETSFVVPKNCQKKQVAIQLKTRFSTNQPRYIINLDLWKKMDAFQQATLVLHEILLRNQILNPHWSNNTVQVRYLTALLASAKPVQSKSLELQSHLNEVGLACRPYTP
ncbi:hypothetical protein [Bdellovibrio bacteriovorus]|uniref:Uncharacterized protein n=1 Tax=Bdellovibrio bacteriovorus TaxID=959 RepID=A0A1Z3N711_BDEBC|nr:hypothetical protein [Bdellovibrio bacteriovorus]ASD63236.1 hypothetical protein B9G79_06470 [Bdellovibrio bacteriovorus]